MSKIAPALLEQQYGGRRVLITGGLGFIGSNLARRLAQAGADVTAVDSLIPEYGGNLQNISDSRGKIHVNIADVRDRFSMRYLVQGHDTLFNLAGQTSHLDSMRDPFTDLEINATAQLSILEACREFNPGIEIVFASTRQVYGRPEYLPVDEKHRITPVDVNGINKVAGEQYHVLYHTVYGLKTRVLRLTNTYGPRMRIKDARQTFLGIWIKQLLTGKPFEVWGGDQLRDFNFVDDVTEAMLQVAADPRTTGQIYNLGHDERITLKELATLLIRANGGEGEFAIHEFPAERKKIDIGDYYSDFAKLGAATGWKPKVKLHEGLLASLDYFRATLPSYL
ncbi:MAG: NAD-dependent epimerase/dehydratase family protein [Opitutus sp.]